MRSTNDIKKDIKEIVALQVSLLKHEDEFKKDHAIILKTLTDTLKNLQDVADEVVEDEFSEMTEEELLEGIHGK